MDDAYKITPTSYATTAPIDRVLSEWADPNGGLTRRVVRLQMVDNIHDARARVKATLMHQKRHSGGKPWLDADTFNNATLKAGQEVRVALSSAETLRLFQELQALYTRASRGIPQQPEVFALVDVSNPHKQEVLHLLETAGDRFWSALAQLRPAELEALADARHHARRRATVAEFKVQMAAKAWDEDEWEDFFAKNTWIFGHGLAYQFLRSYQRQAYVGGKSVGGRRGQVVDWIRNTEAGAKFTVLVDIKKPQSRLLGPVYRNQAHQPSGELSGAVVQLLSNRHTWVTDGALQPANRDDLQAVGVDTYEPRAILVIGDLAQLDSRDKRASFELYRRNLHNPEVLTYDEVLQRAEYMVSYEEETNESMAEDDIPF